VYLVALNDGIREDGISSGGKSFYTRAQTIVEKVLKHTAKIMKKQPHAINSLSKKQIVKDEMLVSYLFLHYICITNINKLPYDLNDYQS
jgi:hypothetical protein